MLAWQRIMQSLSDRIRPGSPSAFGVAAILIAAAIALRLLLSAELEGAQFITLFPAVMAVTLIAGAQAGAFAAVLAIAGAWYCLIAPQFSFAIATLADINALVAFALVASLDVAIVAMLRNAVSRTVHLNQTLTAVFAAYPDAVIVTDKLGAITAANDRALVLFGIRREDLLGAPIGNLIPERFRSDHVAYHAQFMTAPHFRTMGAGLVLFARRADGTEFPADIQIGPIALNGEMHAIATVRDLTAHRALTSALAESQRSQMAMEERQRVADRLRIGEDRLQDFVALASDWMWEQDSALRLSWVSTMHDLSTPDPSERIGMQRWEYQDTGLDPEGWERHRQTLIAREPFQDFRYQTRAANGDVRFSSISGKPLFGEDGTFQGYRGVGRDISARVRADEEIVASKHRAEQADELLRDAMESISEDVLIWDADDRLLANNIVAKRSRPVDTGAFAQGAHFEDIMRQLVAEGTFPEAIGREADWLATRFDWHRTLSGTHEVAMRQGQWLRVTERRMRNGGIVSLLVNITDQKRTEIALRETETHFERAQAVAGIGSWEYNAILELWTLSKEAQRARQLDPTASVARLRAISAYVHPDDRALLPAWIEDLRAGRSPGPIEERIVPPSGKPRILRLEGQAITDPTGKVVRIVGTMQDITEQRMTERQLAQAQKMEALGAVAGGMAHDFNNLLGVIIVSLGFVASRLNATDRLKPLIGEALTAAERGAALVRSLLAFARRQVLHSVVVDIDERISDMHPLISRVLGENIEIALDLASDIWPVIVDPAQLEACIMNLATNARDAMPKGGSLTIKTANWCLDAQNASSYPALVPGEYAVISVTDTGFGIAPDVVTKIFDPFFSTKPTGQGTGLGLSMVFGFASQSGGHVGAESTPNVGTTIRLYLPRAKASIATPKREPEAVEVMPRAQGETILVVEDNGALRHVVARQLEELGYRVLEASNATAALTLLKESPVDLMFSDVVMPGGMDGFDLAKQVRWDWPSTAIVLTSGYAGSHETEHLTGLLATVRLLGKPYDPVTLARTMRDVLDLAATSQR